MDNVKVLYLAGGARSGSTLIGRLMGQPSEAVHVGEMVYIWQRSFRDCYICGCGAPFYDCPFWTEVFERGFGGFANVDYDRILETKQQMERIQVLRHSFSPWKSSVRRQRVEEYARTLESLYRAIAATAGARLVVDGSKSEAYGSFLDTIEGLTVRTLHLVRDSRAVAYSHQRPKPFPMQAGVSGSMPTIPAARMALVWNATNLLLTLKRNRPGRAFLRYEDFVADPESTLRGVWNLTGEPVPSLDILQSSPMHLRVNHTVSGNPDRFYPDVTIRADEEWRRKMSRRDQRLVTALTFPLMLRYGYLPRSGVPKDQKSIQPSCVL